MAVNLLYGVIIIKLQGQTPVALDLCSSFKKQNKTTTKNLRKDVQHLSPLTNYYGVMRGREPTLKEKRGKALDGWK